MRNRNTYSVRYKQLERYITRGSWVYLIFTLSECENLVDVVVNGRGASRCDMYKIGHFRLSLKTDGWHTTPHNDIYDTLSSITLIIILCAHLFLSGYERTFKYFPNIRSARWTSFLHVHQQKSRKLRERRILQQLALDFLSLSQVPNIFQFLHSIAV